MVHGNWRPAVWGIWPILTIAVLGLHVWFPPLDTGVRHDTYSAAAEGQRAFYRLVDMHVETFRNTEPLNHIARNLIADETLCILGPARWPTTQEWDAVLDWVEQGGRLVFACRGVEEQTIPRVDVNYVPHAAVTPDDSLPPTTRLVPSKEIAWWTDGHLQFDRGEVLVEYDGKPQAVALSHGSGRIVVVATPLVFSNQLLTFGDNPALAYRLLEAAGPLSFVTFDESLNASGTAKATGVLLDPALRPLTLQLVLLLVLYAWWNGLRFGPLEQPAVAARHNLVDHTDALGVNYWRMKDGAAVLRSYLNVLRNDLRSQSVGGRPQALLAIAARRLNRPQASVQNDIQSAHQAAKADTLDRRAAARMIVRLAEIRAALARPSRDA